MTIPSADTSMPPMPHSALHANRNGLFENLRDSVKHSSWMTFGRRSNAGTRATSCTELLALAARKPHLTFPVRNNAIYRYDRLGRHDVCREWHHGCRFATPLKPFCACGCLVHHGEVCACEPERFLQGHMDAASCKMPGCQTMLPDEAFPRFATFEVFLLNLPFVRQIAK